MVNDLLSESKAQINSFVTRNYLLVTWEIQHCAFS